MIALQLLWALLGSLGFALIFHMPRRHLLPASLGGLLSWGVYLLCAGRIPGTFLTVLAASAFAALYARTLAQLRQAPVTLFLLTAMVPLIPGSSLYRTMRAIVSGSWLEAARTGTETARFALGIAAGMSLVWILYDTMQRMAGVHLNRAKQNDTTPERAPEHK